MAAIQPSDKSTPETTDQSESGQDSEDVLSAEDEARMIENCGMSKYYEEQKDLKQEKEEIAKAALNNEITPGRAKLQLWLYRTLRIVMTDGRILIGVFLCTDSDANVILGVCSEYTKHGTDERMLGLVMVPGESKATPI